MSVLGDFVSWWVAQLRGLLPAREGHSNALIADVQPGGETIAWVQRRNRRETPVADPSPAKKTGRILLRVPPGAVLERSLTLPIATEGELDRVIAYEVDRISPFSAPEVAWTFAVEQRDRAAGRLLVRVALLPRAGLEPVLQRLRQWGAAPAAVLARRGEGFWSIPLAPPGHAGGGAGRRRAAIALALCCAFLAFVAAALPFVLQERALRRQEARIAALRPAVAEADALRRRIASRAGGSGAVATEAARTGDMLNILATLTTLLPDDTYLTALSVRQRAITVAGRSASAARLIPLLAADPATRNAAFAAPVTRVGGTNDDVFSIRAEFGS